LFFNLNKSFIAKYAYTHKEFDRMTKHKNTFIYKYTKLYTKKYLLYTDARECD